MTKPSGIRAYPSTIEALRMTGSEMAVILRRPLKSDDERIRELIAHWERTKADYYAIRTPAQPVNP
ncbi:MAG: hypothetical protein DCC55_25740 [Chloroflexi bacterium]|nr:MAG: hypothetical protein DCC55_25740 [Chloroflexota bacterium]